MIYNRLDFLIISGIFLITSNPLALIASLVGIIYYISILKVNVVDVKYQGKWLNYFKAIFKK